MVKIGRSPGGDWSGWSEPHEDTMNAMEPNLLILSFIAFLAVFLVLSLLAAVMHGLTLVFPYVETALDAGGHKPPPPLGTSSLEEEMVAAITVVAARAHPGMKVSRIEEME